jgi:tRNA threonylcarbamoyladenosine biosynthesis protein TsaE
MLNLHMEQIFSLAEIQEVAKYFWQQKGQAKVFALHGNLGAGKTTFVHALCDSKGVKDVVSSPTFSIINEYRYPQQGEERKIYHIDLYRMNSDDEARQAGIEDCLYSGEICLVEWPEKAPEIFPPDTIHIYIEPVDAQRRKISIINN